MSERPDDPRIDDALRQALRERASEEPPSAIDARILAAARRASGSRPRPTGARRWLPRLDTPLATAAVVMASAALLLLMREQGQFDSAVTREIGRQVSAPSPAADVAPATAPVAQPPDAAGTADTEIRREVAAPPAAAVGTAADRLAEPAARGETVAPANETLDAGSHPSESAPTLPARAEAPASPAAAAPGAEPEPDRDGNAALAHDRGTVDTRSDAAAPSTAPSADAAASALEKSVGGPSKGAETESIRAAVRAKAAVNAAPLTAQEQDLQAIRELIRGGRLADAKAALAQFVKTYPDYRVPADILQTLQPSD